MSAAGATFLAILRARVGKLLPLYDEAARETVVQTVLGETPIEGIEAIVRLSDRAGLDPLIEAAIAHLRLTHELWR
jgi:hypothetical protein